MVNRFWFDRVRNTLEEPGSGRKVLVVGRQGSCNKSLGEG